MVEVAATGTNPFIRSGEDGQGILGGSARRSAKLGQTLPKFIRDVCLYRPELDRVD